MKPFSIVIITYNRPADALALLKNICSLEKGPELLEEILLLNNASTADYSEVEQFIQNHPEWPIRYISSTENLGVAKGRNLSIKESKAPILIMLDDDAELQNKDALVNLQAIYANKQTSRPTAIVSFKVLYFDTLEMQKNAFPHKQFNKHKNKDFFETYYYAGGAHAITREALNKVGSYPTDFFYGMEEYDLSYRLLDAGYGIVYNSAVVMLHKESPLGRKPKDEKLRMMWLNKSKVAWRYLPEGFFYTTVFMWALQYLKATRFDVAGFIKGWKEIFAISRNEKRRPVSASTLQYLKKVKARLWY